MPIDMEALDPHLRLILAGCAYALAYGVGIALFWWMARRRGLATAGVRSILAIGGIAGLAGATIVQVLIGGALGRTIVGGVVVGYLAVILAKRSLGLRRPLGDLFAVALAGGEAVGRIGCFFAGCCFGRVTNVPWAVLDHGALRHPTQLYSALAAALTLAIILALERRATLPENGIFYAQGALFAMSRFVIEIYREPAAPAGGLTLAQDACIVGFAFFAVRLFELVQRRARRVAA